jgi:hypothetical protein
MLTKSLKHIRNNQLRCGRADVIALIYAVLFALLLILQLSPKVNQTLMELWTIPTLKESFVNLLSKSGTFCGCVHCCDKNMVVLLLFTMY